jgi:hypothetical protein
MRTLKLTFGTLVIFLLTFTSCKKNKDKPEQADTIVAAADLLGYQMYWTLIDPDGTQNLRILYFSKEGSEIKATLDGLVTRIIKTIEVKENTLRLDLNDDGSVVYTFVFDKKDGEISIVSSKFFNINNPAYRTSGGIILRLAKFQSVKNKTLKHSSGQIISFGVDTWRYSAFPNVVGTYYEIGTGGWKGIINGVDCIGFQGDYGAGIILGMQKYGQKEIITFIPY